MTDTTRPEWMPSDEEMLEATNDSYHKYEIDYGTEWDQEPQPIYTMARRTGLRAQIAVLEEMREAFSNRDAFANGEENWILAKIAALQKELSA